MMLVPGCLPLFFVQRWDFFTSQPITQPSSSVDSRMMLHQRISTSFFRILFSIRTPHSIVTLSQSVESVIWQKGPMFTSVPIVQFSMMLVGCIVAMCGHCIEKYFLARCVGHRFSDKFQVHRGFLVVSPISYWLSTPSKHSSRCFKGVFDADSPLKILENFRGGKYSD